MLISVFLSVYMYLWSISNVQENTSDYLTMTFCVYFITVKYTKHKCSHFSHFSVYSSFSLTTFIFLYNHLHQPSPELFNLPQPKLCPHEALTAYHSSPLAPLFFHIYPCWKYTASLFISSTKKWSTVWIYHRFSILILVDK